jgi:hypothetical protein
MAASFAPSLLDESSALNKKVARRSAFGLQSSVSQDHPESQEAAIIAMRFRQSARRRQR